MKTPIRFFALVILAFLPAGCGGKDDGYSIGDRGPGGGSIFYIDEADDFSWEGLEVAPDSESGDGIVWSNIAGTAVGATETGIGTGQANTNAILAQAGHTESAAKHCDDLVYGGCDDWFLPSRDEVLEIYTNLEATGLRDIDVEYCWSSSESDESHAWMILFDDGSQYGYSKDSTSCAAYPVRAF